MAGRTGAGDDGAERRDALSIGDLVFLGNTPATASVDIDDAPPGDANELLIADGFNSFGLLHINPNERDLDDCLFRLCEPINYRRLGGGEAAAPPGFVSPRSREAAGEEAGGSGAGDGEEGEEGASGVGNALQFGQTVQLQHVKSGKYLTAAATEVAEEDPECMRCELDNGSEASHFEIVPVWRIQSDGSTVFSSNRVRLLSASLGDHFLHAHAPAAMATAVGGSPEVNLSSVGGGADTAWTVQLYSKHDALGGGGGGGAESSGGSVIQLGEHVSFFHSEGQAHLRVQSASTKRHHAMRAKAGGKSLKTFFQFEAVHAKQGGAVCWDTPYRLRQVTSDAYLAVGRSAAAEAVAAAAMAEGAEGVQGLQNTLATVALTTSAVEADLWEVTPTLVADRQERGAISWNTIRQHGCHLRCVGDNEKGGEGLGAGGAVRWIHLPVQPEDSTSSKARPVFLERAAEARTEDAVCIFPAESPLPSHRLSFVQSCLRSAETYVRAVHGARTAVLAGAEDGGAAAPTIGLFCDMLHRVLRDLRAAEAAGELGAFQAMMCDCKLVDALMWCLSVPRICGCENGKGDLPRALAEPQKLICKALARIIEGHTHNQLHVARRSYADAWLFPALEKEAGTTGKLGALLQGRGDHPFWADVEHIVSASGAEGGAASAPASAAWLFVVVSMFPWQCDASLVFRCAVQDNLDVIMNRVSGATLLQLVGFLLERGPAPQWLDLLSSVCVCNGQRVPQQQEAILRVLLSAKNFEGKFDTGCELVRHRTFVETVRSKNPATLKHYAPKSDLQELDRLLGITRTHGGEEGAALEREQQTAAWDQLVGHGLSCVIALSSVCKVDAPWRAKGPLSPPRGVKLHVQGDTQTTKRGKTTRQYVEGVTYFEASTAEGLKHFEAVLRAGTAHFDRGFNYLGKAMFLEGMSRCLVAFNRVSGIFAKPVEKAGKLLQVNDLTAYAEPSKELTQYHLDTPGTPEEQFGELKWVALEELCWVLEPKALHALVFKKSIKPHAIYRDGGAFVSIKKLDDDERSRFDRQRLLARWYVAQLNLLSMLAYGENTRCSAVLQVLMPFETCFCGMWNANLPRLVRTAFTQLMTNLYVAVAPHQRVFTPHFVRRHAEMRADPNLADEDVAALPQTTPDLMRRVRLLKWLTADFFTGGSKQVIGDLARNKFVLSLLHLQKAMVMFGFYGTAKGIRDFLCNPLLRVMDGRVDERKTLTLDEGFDASDFDDAGDDAAPVAAAGEPGGPAWGPTDRYAVTMFATPVMQCKEQICRVMLQVAGLRVDYRLSKLLHAWWVLGHVQQKQLAATATAVRKEAAVPGGAKIHPGGAAGSEPLALGEVVSSLMGQLDIFKENASAAGAVRVFDELFTQLFHSSSTKVLTLDFEKMTAGPFITTCLDLLMYEDASLFEAAMQLMVRKFETRRALRTVLNGVQLVKRDDVAAAAEKIEASVALLDVTLSSFPVWAMGNWPQHPMAEQERLRAEKLSTVVVALQSLASHVKRMGFKMQAAAAVAPAAASAASGKPTFARAVAMRSAGTAHGAPPVQPAVFQDMLRNFGAHVRVMRILRLRRRVITSSASPERVKRIVEHNRILSVLNQHCFAFLTKFLRHNPANQAVMHDDMKFFAALLTKAVDELKDVHLERLAKGRLKGPTAAMRRRASTEGAPEDTSGPGREKVAARDALLLLLGAMFQNNEELVKKELPQSLVWRFAGMMQQTRKKQFYTNFFARLCTLDGEPVRANQQLIIRVLTDRRFSHALWLNPEYATAANRRDPAYRHIIDLWSVVCTGGSVQVLAKLQGLFPLAPLVETIETEREDAPLCSSLLALLSAAYLATELRAQHAMLLRELAPRVITVCADFATRAKALGEGAMTEADLAVLDAVRGGVLKATLGLMSVLGDGGEVAANESKKAAAAAAAAKDDGDEPLISSSPTANKNAAPLTVRKTRSAVSTKQSAAMRYASREAVKQLEGVLETFEGAALFGTPEMAAVRSQIMLARTKHVVAWQKDAGGGGGGRKQSLAPLTLTHTAFFRFRKLINGSPLLKAREEAEFDNFVRAIEGVYAATDPNDQAYNELSEEQQALDTRSNGIRLTDLVRRIVRHVEPQLLPRPGAADVHITIFKLFRRLVERQLQGDGADHLDPILPQEYAPGLKQLQQRAADVEEHSFSLLQSLREGVLRRLDSLLGIVLLLSIVLTAFLVGGGFVDLKLTPREMQLFNWSCSGIFLLEVLLRGWAMGLREYLADRIANVDLLCTTVDVVFVVGQELLSWEADGVGARAGRLLRLVRLLRFIRFARAAQALHRLLYGLSAGASAEMAAEEKHVAMQTRLANLGVLKLTADALAEPAMFEMRSDNRLSHEVLQTAVRLLERGNRAVQNAMLELLEADDKCGLLHQVLSQMTSATGRVNADLDMLLAAGTGAAVEMPDGGWPTVREATPYHTLVLQLRLLQVCCTRQHAGLQEHLRFQNRTTRPANAVEQAAALFISIAAAAESAPAVIGAGEIELLCATLDFLKDACLGPCVENQKLLLRGGLVKAMMQLLGTTLPGEVFLHAPVAAPNGRGDVLGELLKELEAEVGNSPEARAARSAALNKPRMHCLARVVSPLELKAKCAAVLCALTEGVTDAALVELMVAAMDVNLVLARVRALFLFELQVDALEQEEACKGGILGAMAEGLASAGRLDDSGGDDAAIGASGGRYGAELGSPLEVAKQLLLNAPSGKRWLEALRREGDLLTIVCHTLAFRSEAMREALRRETSALGPECEKPICRSFSGADGIPAVFHELARLHRQRKGEQRKHGGAAARKVWQLKQRNLTREEKQHKARQQGKGIRAYFVAKNATHALSDASGVSNDATPSTAFAVAGAAAASAAAAAADHSMLASEQVQAALAQLMFEQGSKLLAQVGSMSHKHYLLVARNTALFDVEDELTTLMARCTAAHTQAVMVRARIFYEDRLSCVEAKWRNELHKVFFTTPPTTEYIDSEEKVFFKGVDSSTNEDKLAQFQERAQLLCSTVEFNSWLDLVMVPLISSIFQDQSVYDMLRSQEALERISFSVALCNAFLMLISLEHDVDPDTGALIIENGSVNVHHYAGWCQTLNRTLGALQLVLCLTVALMSLAHNFPGIAVHHFRSFVARMRHSSESSWRHDAWAGVLAVLPVVLMQLGAILIAGVLLYFRYGKPGLLYFAAIAAVPLLCFTSTSYIGDEPRYYSSLALKVCIDLIFDPAIAFNILLIGKASHCMLHPTSRPASRAHVAHTPPRPAHGLFCIHCDGCSCGSNNITVTTILALTYFGTARSAARKAVPRTDACHPPFPLRRILFRYQLVQSGDIVPCANKRGQGCERSGTAARPHLFAVPDLHLLGTWRRTRAPRATPEICSLTYWWPPCQRLLDLCSFVGSWLFVAPCTVHAIRVLRISGVHRSQEVVRLAARVLAHGNAPGAAAR